MGVTDVLKKVIADIGSPVDLRRFRDGIDVQVGKKRKRRPLRIGLDVSHWIYKATHGYGHALADENHLTNYGRYRLLEQQQQQHESTAANAQQQDDHESNNEIKEMHPEQLRKFVTQCCLYVLARLKTLREETQAEILVVLDGATPPIKRAVVEKRSHLREDAVRRRDAPVHPIDVSLDDDDDAIDAYNNERTKANRRAGAGRYFSHVVVDLIKAMRTNEIPFMVAPYEADGQLAWMSRQGYIDVVITEDSDLIAQGCVCMIYKLNISMQNQNPAYGSNRSNNNNNNNDNHQEDSAPRSGSCPPRGILVLKDDLGAVTISKKPKDGGSTLDWKDMSDAMLAVAFVAAGSDYCEKLRGIGLVTACHIVRDCFLFRHKDEEDWPIPALGLVLDRLFQETHDKAMRTDLQRREEYRKQFLAAVFMYRHPVVYCPFRRGCKISGESEGGDPELMTYAPYKALLQNKRRREQIVGETVDTPLSTFIAEGWVSPRNKTLYASDPDEIKNLPKLVRKYFNILDEGERGVDRGGPSSPLSDVDKEIASVAGTNRVSEAAAEKQPEKQVHSMVGEKDDNGCVDENGGKSDNPSDKDAGDRDVDVSFDSQETTLEKDLSQTPGVRSQHMEANRDPQTTWATAVLSRSKGDPMYQNESQSSSAQLETQAPDMRTEKPLLPPMGTLNDKGSSQTTSGRVNSSLETRSPPATGALSPHVDTHEHQKESQSPNGSVHLETQAVMGTKTSRKDDPQNMQTCSNSKHETQAPLTTGELSPIPGTQNYYDYSQSPYGSSHLQTQAPPEPMGPENPLLPPTADKDSSQTTIWSSNSQLETQAPQASAAPPSPAAPEMDRNDLQSTDDRTVFPRIQCQVHSRIPVEIDAPATGQLLCYLKDGDATTHRHVFVCNVDETDPLASLLLVGDWITHVNGQHVQGRPLEEVAEIARNPWIPPGSSRQIRRFRVLRAASEPGLPSNVE